MFRHAIRLLARTALVFSAAAAFSAGCTRQAEGERCDAEWAGDQDCESGLICKACGELEDQTVDRCCPPGEAYGVAECQPAISKSADAGHFCSSHHAAPSTGGSSGAGGTSGSGGTGDTSGTGGTGDTAGAGDTGGAAGDRG